MVLGARHQQVLLESAVPHMSCGASGVKNQTLKKRGYRVCSSGYAATDTS
jgi:hypothetical protein